jgi:hypothetical protein
VPEVIVSRQAPASTAQVLNSVGRREPTPAGGVRQDGEAGQFGHGRVDLQHPVVLPGREPERGRVEGDPSVVVGMGEPSGDPLGGAVTVGAPPQQREQG